MRKSSTIQGIALSGIHGDAKNFELLLHYTDGREVGKLLPRDVAEKLLKQLVETL